MTTKLAVFAAGGLALTAAACGHDHADAAAEDPDGCVDFDEAWVEVTGREDHG